MYLCLSSNLFVCTTVQSFELMYETNSCLNNGSFIHLLTFFYSLLKVQLFEDEFNLRKALQKFNWTLLTPFVEHLFKISNSDAPPFHVFVPGAYVMWRIRLTTKVTNFPFPPLWRMVRRPSSNWTTLPLTTKLTTQVKNTFQVVLEL